MTYDLFLGSVETDDDPWSAQKTSKSKNTFNTLKIDTDADVTLISPHLFISAFKTDKPNLQKSEIVLLGPGGSPLYSMSMAELVLQRRKKAEKEKVRVIRNLYTPLMGTSVSYV